MGIYNGPKTYCASFLVIIQSSFRRQIYQNRT